VAEHDSEQKTTNINVLNHFKTGDVFIHLSPAINGWAGFTIFLSVLFLGVFWWRNPNNFFALVANSVTTVAGFLSIFGWLAVAATGGLILNKIFLPAIERVKAIFWPPAVRVHAVTENFAIYSGEDARIHDHSEDKINYRVDVAKLQGQEQGRLPAPAAPVPTGRQLLIDGTIERNLAQGKLTLGPLEDGEMFLLGLKKFFSALVGGIPASGKSTTVFWIFSQLVMLGARGWLVDPHKDFEDEDGNVSLAKELAGFNDVLIFPTIDCDPNGIIQRVRFMYQQLQSRKKPGYIVRGKDVLIGVIDEFNSVVESIGADVVVIKHEGQPMNFAQSMSYLEREGRKYGIIFILIGHRWSRQDIKDVAIRTNASTILAHRFNDEGQAKNLLGESHGKQALKLTSGQYWLAGLFTGEPKKITTPMISGHDVPLVLDIRGRHTRLPQGEYVETVMSDVMSDTISTSYPEDACGDDSGDDMEPLVKHVEMTSPLSSLPGDLSVKLLQVLELDEQHKSQNEIIQTVWGVDPSHREGRAAADELRQIRAWLAAQQRQRLEAN
jgi:hypothetical protein